MTVCTETNLTSALPKQIYMRNKLMLNLHGRQVLLEECLNNSEDFVFLIDSDPADPNEYRVCRWLGLLKCS